MKTEKFLGIFTKLKKLIPHKKKDAQESRSEGNPAEIKDSENKISEKVFSQSEETQVARRRRAASEPVKKPKKEENASKPSASLFGRIVSLRFLFQTFYKNIALLLVVGMVSTLAAMIFFTISNENSAYKTMSLNYEESTKGQTPKGSRFSLSNFLTQDYMNAVIERIGFQDELTAAELTDIVSVYPTSNGRVITDENGYYINSSYIVSVNLPWELRRKISAQDLLDEVCYVFEKKYTEENRVTTKSLTIDDDYSDMEYEEISAYFSLMLKRIINYTDVRNNQAGSFISEDDMTYSLIRKACVNLKMYTLAEFDSYVWENGIAKDRQRRIMNLKEQNRELNWDYSSNSQKSTILMDILEMYNNKMVSSVLIPTYDSKGAFYMSRTKVGIDDLALDANSYLTDATAQQKNIQTNLSKVTALEQANPNGKKERADQMVQSISDELCKIVEQLNQLDDACYTQRISRYLIFTEPIVSKMGQFGVKDSVLVAAVICVLCYLGAVFSRYWVERKKWLQ